MYPMIVSIIGILVVTCMLIFVIPKFEAMLQGQGESLPWATQFLIDSSHFFIKNIHIIIFVFSVVVFFIYRYFKSQEGGAFLDRIVFQLPFFGVMVQKAAIARFSRTLQTLLASGVNLMDAIDICKVTMDQVVLEEAVANIRSEVESGKSLGSVMEKIVVFPKMVTHMIRIGESTGNLDKMLEKIADFYEEEVSILVSGISRLIEPFVLVFLGVIVGGIMIAMYLPIFKFAGGGT
jgi:type IV pilus assembly protein PilC